MNTNSSSTTNTATQVANKDNVSVRWGYGIKGNTRVILDEKDSTFVEMHFQVREETVSYDIVMMFAVLVALFFSLFYFAPIDGFR
jgi:hypothetical protein